MGRLIMDRSSHRVVLAGVVTLLLVSCGDNSRSDSNKIFTPQELATVLLTPADFGDDWIADQRGVFETRAEGPQVFDSTAWCPESMEEVEGLYELDSIAADSGAIIEISQTRMERRSFSGVSQQLWSNDQAGRFVEIVDSAMKFCDGQSWNPASEEAEQVSIEYLADQKIGDSSTVGIITALTPGPDGQYVWKSRTIAVQVGSIVMVLRELDVQIEDSDPFYNDAMWNELVDMAMARMKTIR